MRVMIVEDDLLVADLMEEGLVEAGLEVCGIARSVPAAISMARHHKPDLAVVDINLAGGTNGAEFPSRLEATWPIGVLFASGSGLVSQLEDTGAIAVIQKPFSVASLVAALSIVVDIISTGSTLRRLPLGTSLIGPTRGAPLPLPAGVVHAY